jgi:hypothetical protein
LSLFKEGKVDVGVFLLLDEMRMSRKGIGIWMLKDEIAVLSRNVMGEDPIWQGVQSFDCIGRVRKDYVELLVADVEEFEGIIMHDSHLAEIEGCGSALDESGIVLVHFDGYDGLCSSGSEFV